MDYVLFHILSGNKLHINIKGEKKRIGKMEIVKKRAISACFIGALCSTKSPTECSSLVGKKSFSALFVYN
jgi:hypothetical protein